MPRATELTVPDVTTGEFVNPDDVLDLLEEAVEAGQDIMEQAVAAGDNVAEQGSKGKFVLGYLACLVDKRYGENRIAEFADGVRMPVKRIEEYRTLCRYYQRSVYTEFSNRCPYPLYSHYVMAMQFDDIENSLAFLEKVDTKKWKCGETKIEIKKLLGKPIPPMRQTWAVQILGMTKDGNLIVGYPGASMETVKELADKHKSDRDFSIALNMTYTAPKQGETDDLRDPQPTTA